MVDLLSRHTFKSVETLDIAYLRRCYIGVKRKQKEIASLVDTGVSVGFVTGSESFVIRLKELSRILRKLNLERKQWAELMND